MRLYLVLQRPNGAVVVLKDGFSLPAFILGPAWLLWHRLWIEASAALLVWGVALFLSSTAGTVILLLLHWLVGLEGNEWRRRALRRKGFVETQIHTAREIRAMLRQALNEARG